MNWPAYETIASNSQWISSNWASAPSQRGTLKFSTSVSMATSGFSRGIPTVSTGSSMACSSSKTSKARKCHHDLFWRKLNMRNILCNVCRPIPTLVAEVWRRNLDYAKNLQAKYFTSESIPIYGTLVDQAFDKKWEELGIANGGDRGLSVRLSYAMLCYVMHKLFTSIIIPLGSTQIHPMSFLQFTNLRILCEWEMPTSNEKCTQCFKRPKSSM